MMNKRVAAMIARLVCIAVLVSAVLPATLSGVRAYADVAPVQIQFLSPEVGENDGFIPDHGEPYGTRNGYTYGWDRDHTHSSVPDDVYGVRPDLTSIPIQVGGYWEIALPNGRYDVTVSVGDSVYESENTLYVEGTLYWDRRMLSAGQEDVATHTIELADGRLTVSSDGDSDTTTIRSIQIVRSVMPVFREMERPHISLPAESNGIPGASILLSGKQRNTHNAVPAVPLAGLDSEIGRYKDEEVSVLEGRIAEAQSGAANCGGCSVAQLLGMIEDGGESPVVIRTGHLNLGESVTLGSPDKPVYLIADGINTNNPMSLVVYGGLVVQGAMNANRELEIDVRKAGNSANDALDGSLRVKGAMHLNNDSSVSVAGDFAAGSLTYNNGRLDVRADRLIVEGSLHINTEVEMAVGQEMIVGNIVSNNSNAAIAVRQGDLFIEGNLDVNNHLELRTGGQVAVGGNITANRKPIIATGQGGDGQTKLKYTLYGVLAEYFSEPNLSGDRIVTVDPTVDLDNLLPVSAAGLQDGSLSVRWSGRIEANYSEAYRFELRAKGGARMWIEGELLIDSWTADGTERTYTALVDLEAGGEYDIRIEYKSASGQPRAELSWASESQSMEVVPQVQLMPFAAPHAAAVPAEEEIALSWDAAFNARGYEVEADGSVHRLGREEERFVHAPLDSGTEHRYRVRALSDDIRGPWSEALELWTLPGVPDNIRLTSTGTSVSLAWDAVRGADRYEIETYNSILNNGAATEYTEDNLNPNTQRTYRIRAVNTSGPGRWSSLIVKSTVLAVPSNLHGIAADTSIALRWDPVSGADAYELEIDGSVQGELTDSEFTHAGLAPGTDHTYRVRAGNADGISEWSAPVTVRTLSSLPSNLHAIVYERSVALSWEASAGATGYELEVDGAIVSTGESTAYEHVGLEPASEHQYRLRAVNGSIPGEWSGYKTVVTLPSVPDNVRAIVTGSTEIELRWDPVPGAVRYEAEVDGSIIDIGMNTFHVHGPLAPYSNHAYRVRAVGVGGAGAWSAQVEGTTGLGRPQNVTAEGTANSIMLTWDKVQGADGYEVLADGELIDVGAANRYEHKGLTPHSRHVYRVRATSGALTGEWSDTVSQVTALGTPQFAHVEPLSDRIALTWNAVHGATGYDLEADGKVIGLGAVTSYTHEGLQPNTSHTYRIRARNGSDVSDWSGLSEWSTDIVLVTAPGIPGNITAEATTADIRLAWNAVQGAKGYEIEIDGKESVKVPQTGYVHAGLDPNTMHTYRVRAYNDGGKSAYSELLTKTTTPELKIRVGRDTQFNFVILLPRKPEAAERTVTVTYNPDELTVIDLSAVTPELETGAGPIANTAFSVIEAANGKIVYAIRQTDRTEVNSIRFQALTSEYSSVTYTIE